LSRERRPIAQDPEAAWTDPPIQRRVLRLPPHWALGGASPPPYLDSGHFKSS